VKSLQPTILLSFLLVCCFSQTSVAQSADQPLTKYPPDALREEFQLVRTNLEKIHPGLYWHKSKAILDEQLDSCYRSIRDSMTIYGFYGVMRFLMSAIDDGHAECDLPKQALQHFLTHVRFFPMRLWFTGDKAYVLCDKDSIPSGTEIISINRHPMDEVIRRVFDLFPGDGVIRTNKLHQLNDDRNNFSAFYYFAYGPSSSFTVEYRAASGEIRNTNLAADYDRNIHCAVQGEKFHGLSLQFYPNQVAVLTVGRFDTKVSIFNAFLKRSFAEISQKQCRALILDMRNNGGGEDANGAALYSFLTTKPFQYYASIETTQRKLRPEEHAQLRLQQPAATPFSGEVYILTNGWTFSSATEFCSVTRSEKRGPFIGEETGGGYYGNTSGDDTTLVLPHTHLTVAITKEKYTMAVREAQFPDRGIIPDYPILPSLTDWIGQNDVQLKLALRLVGAK
jgi:hypothetical protein